MAETKSAERAIRKAGNVHLVKANHLTKSKATYVIALATTPRPPLP